jgi:hypothetical protein
MKCLMTLVMLDFDPFLQTITTTSHPNSETERKLGLKKNPLPETSQPQPN